MTNIFKNFLSSFYSRLKNLKRIFFKTKSNNKHVYYFSQNLFDGEYPNTFKHDLISRFSLDVNEFKNHWD